MRMPNDRNASARGLTLPDSYKWRVLETLAGKHEEERRTILRPHEEAGLTWELDAPTIKMRNDLDEALGDLTLYEIRSQFRRSKQPKGFGGIPEESDPTVAAPQSVYESLSILFGSEAMLNYCDSYLYFGIRFFAERLLPVSEATQRKLEENPPHESHWRPFALLTPPPVEASEDHERRFRQLQTTEKSPQEQAALRFLDGFFDKPLDYELWLRGLLENRDRAQEDRFRTITAGLIEWIEKHVEFYLSLAEEEKSHVTEVSEGTQAEIASQLLGEKAPAELGASFMPSEVFKRSAYSMGRMRKIGARYRPAGGWRMIDPMAARCGLADVYWIARLLRASVSSAGTVSYQGISWLHLLRYRVNVDKALDNGTDPEQFERRADRIAQYEEALRAVFEFVCDLVQNAIALTDSCVTSVLAPQAPPSNGVSKVWQSVCDEEFAVVEQQRNIRAYKSEEQAGSRQRAATSPPGPSTNEGNDGWSQRVRTGSSPGNLVGLAFSGGGVRSATFNLGVLQGLQQLDVLRHVDYLSTVSGGGFIGSWLIANVRRSAHWLGRVTSWNTSVAHLRAYSSYLAPRTGILSFDTWTMGTTWLRNTFLIQITGLAWLFVLLLSALVIEPVFVGLWVQARGGFPYGRLMLWASAFVWTVAILYQLTKLIVITQDRAAGQKTAAAWVRSRTKSVSRRIQSDAKWVVRLSVIPAWLGAICIASLFWRDARIQSHQWVRLDSLTGYAAILKSAWSPWWSILLFSLLTLSIIAFLSMRTPYRTNAVWIGPLCGAVLYLGLAGIFYMDRALADTAGGRSNWIAYVFTPTLVLFAFTLSIVLLIGLTGRYSNEAFREWWTRLGTWLLTAALAAVAVTGVAAFGPELTAGLWNFAHNPALKWSAVLSWAGTVVGGLLAGKSSKTNGEGKSPNLQLLAILGGLLFILGAALLSSTLLYFLIFKLLGSDDACYPCFLTTVDNIRRSQLWIALGACSALGFLFSYFFELNIFGLNQFYRNRIVRCYLGASRLTPGVRKPNRVTGFDFNDDLKLHKLKHDRELDQDNGAFRGPFPIINCALNLGGSKDLTVKTRHSASFSLTPLHCGADRPMVGYAPTAVDDLRSGDDHDSEEKGLKRAKTKLSKRKFANGVMLGQAVAVSGAAVSPNMGYNTSPLVSFLLTMFNVRLGWWFPNPGGGAWYRGGLGFGLYYLTRELFGMADERRRFLNVSDGGHFENLGVYELVRRRCKVIIACDAECDENYQFGGLGNLIRICEADFAAIIDLDVQAIGDRKEGFGLAHCAIGKIKYNNGSLGYLIYLKSSMTGDEPVSVKQYRSAHPSFPHESTGDQFFSEDQFESYRTLGQHAIEHSFRGTVPGQHPVVVAERLSDVLTPMGCPSQTMLKHSATLSAIWDKFRQSPSLHSLLSELMGGVCPPVEGVEPSCSDELAIILQLIQLMEDVFLDLRLDDFWEHPDNRGWAILFMQWARSAQFRKFWNQNRQTFGIRFEHFCASRLGLERDRPIVRV